MENNENMNNQVNENNNIQLEVNNQINNVENNVQPEINSQSNVVESNVQPEVRNDVNPVINNTQSTIDNTNKPTNNNNLLLIIVALLIIGIGGYFAYTKFIAKEEPKGNDNPTPTPIITPTPTSKPVVTPTVTPNNDTQNDVKIDNIVLSNLENDIKSFKVIDFEPEKLKELNGEKTFDQYSEGIKLKVSVNGTKVSVTYIPSNDDPDAVFVNKEFDNVSKVVYSDYGNCSSNFNVYIFSNNKVYSIDVNYREEIVDENNLAEELKNSEKYIDIYMDYLHPATCDFIPLWVGRTEDGKYYDLATATEYLDNTYYFYDDGNNYIKKDKTYKLGNYSGKIKIGFINAIYEGLVAYIDENNYFYEMNYELNEFKLVSNEKITEVKKEEDKLKFTFADGNKTEIEMVYIEAYK